MIKYPSAYHAWLANFLKIPYETAVALTEVCKQPTSLSPDEIRRQYPEYFI